MALRVNEVSQIYLGIQGENGCREITIDVSDWLVAHPQGSVTIWHKRNGESIPQPTGAIFDDEAGTVTWTPSSTDTYYAGEGEAEIRLTENEVIKKSRAVRTDVSEAVTAGGTTIGSDWQAYIDAVDALRAEAVEAANDAEGVALHPPYINMGTMRWMIWSNDEDDYVDSGVSAQGVPGPQGVPGIQGVAGPTGPTGPAGPAGSKGDKGDRGEKGDKGDSGSAFDIKKSYASIEAMEEDFHGTDVLVGQFVIISSGMGTVDNGKVYRKDLEEWTFIVQMAGVKGDRGEKGDKGDTGETGSTGPTGPTGPAGSQGPQGNPGVQGPPGEGVPLGGTTGKFLRKLSGTDYDTGWEPVYGSEIPMTSSDNTPLSTAIDGKVDAQQSVSDAGKALGINSQGQVVPVPFSGEDFTGATASTAGAHGYVPAPAAGDQNKVLTGAGTWEVASGSRLYVVDLDAVSNTTGSYTHTTIVQDMTGDMKAVAMECSDPTIFKAPVSIVSSTDSVTLTCDEVAGTSTVKVSFLIVGNGNPLSSTEYAALDTRIGQLSDLETTDKSDIVSAINEVDDGLGTVNEQMAPDFSTTGLTLTGCTYVSGGYFKIGKLVVIQIRVQASNNTSFNVSGFPKGVGNKDVGGWPPKIGDEVVNFKFQTNDTYMFSYGAVTQNTIYGATCIYLAG